jgi:AcrR family transcriptional regulator
VIVGRTRTFEPDEALDRAMIVFWRQGYDGTSMTDLTDAMGISRPSLYAAFGNKEELFRRALERYGEVPSAYVGEALGAPTARAVAERLLRGAADLHTDARTPAGCLAVHGAPTCAEQSSEVGQALIAFRRAGEAAIRERLERARAEGDLPADADPAELADFLRTVVYGMAVKAASGSTREELERVIARTMRAWPQ